MYLTDDEKRVLNGESGEGLQTAMEIVVRLGDVLKAERLIDIASGHITMLEMQPDHIYITHTQKMANYGCKVKVPTTNNPTFIDYERPELGSPEMVAPDHPLIEGFGRLGVCNSFTCQPFLNGNLPRCGQHVGWAEASAVVTANSILGARTNPLPAMIDLVCAILGKVPYCGLHLDENRKGQVLVNVDLSKDTPNELDYALLGFFTADTIGERVPVYTGIPLDVPLECLQAIGVNVPSYLYHVVGVTPEAPSVERAFGWDTPWHVVKFGDKELRDMSERHAAGEQSDVDIIMIGCPHLPLNKVIDYARALDGKRISDNVEFYLLTSASIRSLARESGYEQTIEKSGAKLANMCSLFTNYGDKPSKKVLTTSAMYCQYGPGSSMLATSEECIDAALTGKFTPRR